MKIALIGPNANDSVMQWGNYNGFPSHTSTLYEALKERIPANQLIYDFGCDRTSGISLESVFSQCSIDGKPGFRSTYGTTSRWKANLLPSPIPVLLSSLPH